MRARRLLGPAALAVVLGTALLVGSGAFAAPRASGQARVAAIERQVKCPSCFDLSVAQSNSPSSIALRHQIAAEVAAGESDAQILNGIVARYGTTALLLPPAGGLTTVLWAVPIALGVVAVLGLTATFVRRRRPA